MIKILDDQLIQECFETDMIFDFKNLLEKDYWSQLFEVCARSAHGDDCNYSKMTKHIYRSYLI